MKKFLFTLAALLMAGSAFAANVYIADREFTAEEIGTQVWLDVMVQLDNEYINGWDFTFTYPEGLEVTNAIKKNNAVLTQTAVTNEFGDEENVAFTVNGDAQHSIGACIQGGYWDPDGDGEYEMYGAVKIGPTGEFMLYQIRVKPTEEFTGGNIEIAWMVSGGFDNRNGQTKIQSEGNTTVALTVAGGTEPEVTEKPVITWEANDEAQEVVITVTGAGELVLYNDDVEVARGESPLTYTVPYTDDPEGEEMGFSATAQEEGKEVSEYALATVEVPGKTPVEPEVTEKPVITWEANDEAQEVVITVTGAGELVLYNDDIEVARGESPLTYTVPYTDDPEGEEMGFSATAQEEGKEVSEYALATVEVPGKTPVEPEVTEAPVINVEHNDDAYIITATGDGEVILYVNNEPVENPYTIARGEEDVTIFVYATAQEEGKEMGTSDVMPIVIEKKEGGEEPVDPEDHTQGVWIVTYEKDGAEHWDKMLKSNDDYTCIIRFSYGYYGTFPYDPNLSMAENDALRDNMEFYIVIDGVRYGAVAGDLTPCVLGTAMSNPIEPNENNYVLEHALGRVYNMGVAFDEYDLSQPMYVYAAVAAYTELDEMNADKAVAGVRYFNMAGQEMQEANGMTIVVTTYTDGSTSAVKVIK